MRLVSIRLLWPMNNNLTNSLWFWMSGGEISHLIRGCQSGTIIGHYSPAFGVHGYLNQTAHG